ncbi:TIGR02444 family protein [Methylobacterium gnaphalii]|uniref:TIGR02444 family protein n=1 Tax=Methylobacterium gnaphalii TaxID=1010610 RepID=A0A512JQ04_9HYPH|nr:TIGR02444 family protein [Methylobacterium gnaphalii]GEP12029.1 hypothetical protein MGN01_38740 [Methylobacterium gnaphalii]GJD71609.1 hypothetical protein MMMDOFMJ_4572 [Methylobacterium gnaphalii]GLS51240.1 hypothetical protein GCM10007885_40950 [Methylobacterium gnaphalii]
MKDVSSDLQRFAFERYQEPGVGSSCLEFQEAGFDVILVLYLVWCAEAGYVLTLDDVVAADRRLSDWRRQVIEPLRSVRRLLKTADLLPGVSLGPYRDRIKTMEIEAETLAFESLASIDRRRSDPLRQSAENYLRMYSAFLGRIAPEQALQRICLQLPRPA